MNEDLPPTVRELLLIPPERRKAARGKHAKELVNLSALLKTRVSEREKCRRRKKRLSRARGANVGPLELEERPCGALSKAEVAPAIEPLPAEAGHRRQRNAVRASVEKRKGTTAILTMSVLLMRRIGCRPSEISGHLGISVRRVQQLISHSVRENARLAELTGPVLRMHRRRRTPSEIAARLDVAVSDVELIIIAERAKSPGP